jgi:hypothetical protein
VSEFYFSSTTNPKWLYTSYTHSPIVPPPPPIGCTTTLILTTERWSSKGIRHSADHPRNRTTVGAHFTCLPSAKSAAELEKATKARKAARYGLTVSSSPAFPHLTPIVPVGMVLQQWNIRLSSAIFVVVRQKLPRVFPAQQDTSFAAGASKEPLVSLILRHGVRYAQAEILCFQICTRGHLCVVYVWKKTCATFSRCKAVSK